MAKSNQPLTSLDPFATDDIDLEHQREKIVDFVRDSVDDAGADGAVVAMSGGVDSTLTATLTAEAVGPPNVLGIVMPWLLSAEADALDAVDLATELHIECRMVHLQPIATALSDCVSADQSTDSDAIGNAVARTRMTTAYFEASRRNYLVVGTANRTERLLGYFTKYGDGGADCFPLGELFKTDVLSLAEHVGVPRRVLERTPTAGLRAGQTDRHDLGASYRVVDRILTRLVDANLTIEETAAEVGVEVNLVRRFAKLHLETAHKRRPPETVDSWRAREEPTYFHDLELRLETGDRDRAESTS